MKWEFAILQAMQGMRNGWLDALMVFVTRLGDGGMLWIGLGLFFLCRKKTRLMELSLLVSLLAGHLVGNCFLKPLAARPRPCHVMPGVELLIRAPGSYSFPSGHTMSSFEGAFSIFLFQKKWGLWAMVMAALIACSRMYLFVHFPTDVLAGLVLGLIHAWLIYKLVSWYERKLQAS